MYTNEVIWHGHGRTTWETSHRCCIMRTVVRKEVAVGERFDIFLDSECNQITQHKKSR